jgi:hypothetical protein
LTASRIAAVVIGEAATVISRVLVVAVEDILVVSDLY